MIIVPFKRIFAGLLACAAAGAWASVPVLPLGPTPPAAGLGEHMIVQRLPVSEALDPDTLWQGATAAPANAQPRWQLAAGERMVGRITLQGSGRRETYVVAVPAPSVDEVRVWHREAGGAWEAQVAGDRIALSRWPFAAQFPAFPITVREAPVDLIVAVANSGPLGVAVDILPDAVFRETQTLSANLSGVIMGLGAMVAVVCLLGALQQRRRANWLLAAVCGFTLLMAACVNGYMALWLTPEAAAFNDASKPFVGVVLGGLMVALTAESLDSRYLSRGERGFSLAVALLCLAWAIAQALWLPLAWRAPGLAACAVLTTVCCIALYARSAKRGGRQSALVGGGVACLALVWVVVVMFRDFTGGVDVRSALVGILLYAALLLFRQALLLRDRYGRDVLGRAAVSANRDPLTALLSYVGFELAYDETLLRQAAGARAASMMLFVLPGLEESGAEHGFVITERALVRFAAALQSALGNSWAIARLSKTRFACISTQPYDEAQVAEEATRVLARCARISRPLEPLADFDLRIACLHRPMESDGLGRTLKELERAALATLPGKRIAFV
ncbi:MAG TPA: 7TM-DISM domain-containing protein [Burkholderiaceae bacterium]